MRKIIAKRLSESLFTAPHYNLVIEVSMDEAMKSRAVINTVPDTKVSFNDPFHGFEGDSGFKSSIVVSSHALCHFSLSFSCMAD